MPLPGLSPLRGASLAGLEFDVTGVAVNEPYEVQLAVPADPLPPGGYRRSQEVQVVRAAQERESLRLVQPFTVLP